MIYPKEKRFQSSQDNFNSENLKTPLMEDKKQNGPRPLIRFSALSTNNSLHSHVTVAKMLRNVIERLFSKYFYMTAPHSLLVLERCTLCNQSSQSVHLFHSRVFNSLSTIKMKPFLEE